MSLGRVAVTGGTGFIGPYIVRALREAGWQVRLLVRPGRHRVFEPEIETVEGDLADVTALTRLLDGADVLVHAAGAIKGRSRRDFLTANRDGAHLLAVLAARRPRPPRVVMLSSLAAREPALSDYAFSKAAGEEAFHEQGLSELAILRPAAVYGPGDRETGSWLRAAWGPVLPVPDRPSARLCLIHAADVATAVTALCPRTTPSGTFELCDHRTDGYTWRELAETARACAGGKGRIIAVPPLFLRGAARMISILNFLGIPPAMLTSGKAREILHPDWSSSSTRQPPSSLWKPVWTLRDGLTQTIETLRPATATTAQA